MSTSDWRSAASAAAGRGSIGLLLELGFDCGGAFGGSAFGVGRVLGCLLGDGMRSLKVGFQPLGAVAVLRCLGG